MIEINKTNFTQYYEIKEDIDGKYKCVLIKFKFREEIDIRDFIEYFNVDAFKDGTEIKSYNMDFKFYIENLGINYIGTEFDIPIKNTLIGYKSIEFEKYKIEFKIDSNKFICRYYIYANEEPYFETDSYEYENYISTWLNQTNYVSYYNDDAIGNLDIYYVNIPGYITIIDDNFGINNNHNIPNATYELLRDYADDKHIRAYFNNEDNCRERITLLISYTHEKYTEPYNNKIKKYGQILVGKFIHILEIVINILYSILSMKSWYIKMLFPMILKLKFSDMSITELILFSVIIGIIYYDKFRKKDNNPPMHTI